MPILINNYEFHVRAPYSAGHTLTEAEARSFNEWRARGVISNMRALINDSERGLPQGELIADAELAQIQSIIAAFDASYAHPMERGSRNTKNVLQAKRGLIERTARECCAKWLEEKNRQSARRLHKHDFDAEVDRLTENNTYWREKAREVIRMRAMAASDAG